MKKIITEGKARIEIHTGKISKKLPVFYNPDMKENRDISIQILKAMPDKEMRIALPLAGSGVRAIRFALELPKEKIHSLHCNDYSFEAVNNIKNNVALNPLPLKIAISEREANAFLLSNNGLDYIDIDPFGSPNPFLDCAIKRISRNGILAITATDTAPLAGTYPKTCERKYWAKPLRNELKHEIGLRILIRKVQLIGAQYDKALTPIFAYARMHYLRVYFRCTKAKQNVDAIIRQHQFLLHCNDCLFFTLGATNTGTCTCGHSMDYAGPLWTGTLFDSELVKSFSDEVSLVKTIKQEIAVDTPFYYDIHALAKKYKLTVPKYDRIKEKTKAVPTHFSAKGLKSPLAFKDFLAAIKELQ